MGFDDIDRKFKPKEIKLECLGCQSTVGVEMESSRTAYHFDGDKDDPANPNKPIPLCRSCAKDHHKHWDDMWAQYYNSIGG